MNIQADQIDMFDTPKRRGRPRKAGALSPVERQRKRRERIRDEIQSAGTIPGTNRADWRASSDAVLVEAFAWGLRSGSAHMCLDAAAEALDRLNAKERAVGGPCYEVAYRLGSAGGWWPLTAQEDSQGQGNPPRPSGGLGGHPQETADLAPSPE